MLQAFSVVSDMYKFVRPEITSERSLKLIECRHPVVEQVMKDKYIPNDIVMDKTTNILLITGPNMAGKSTYMRQCAITVIMAQIGCFVPCKSASLPIFDKIFTRIGASDDLVSGESTFMVEMLEAKNAITNATNDSLILFDELGRGTATYDGIAIAQAILEYCTKTIKCKTLFSTHYHELTSLDEKYKTIKNIHVSATEEGGKLTFLHKIEDGAVDKSYGVHVASLAKLPDEIIENASKILRKYEGESNNSRKSFNEQLELDFNNSNSNELKDKLDEIDVLKLTPIEAINILYELKEISKK